MIRKYHNHKLHTTPWHHEEEPLNHHETPGRQIKQSNQLSQIHFHQFGTFKLIKTMLRYLNVCRVLSPE